MEIDLTPAAPPPTAEASTVEADSPPADAAPPAEVSEGSPPAVEPEVEADKEEKTEPEKKETPKESALLRSLRKREATVVQRQQEQARTHEDLQSKIRGFNDHITKVDTEVKAFRAEQAAAKGDPVAFLEKATGKSFEDIVRVWMNNGKAPIEQVVDEKSSALEKKIAELEKREKDREEQGSARQVAQANAQIDQEIVSLGLSAKFPTLAALYKGSEADLVAEVRRTSQASSEAYEKRTRQRIQYTPEQVLTHLEKQHAERYKKLSPSTPSLGTAVTESAVQAATKSAEKNGQKEPMATGKTAPTLTGKGASQRASVPKDDLLLLNPEEEKRRTLEAIENARKGQPTRAA